MGGIIVAVGDDAENTVRRGAGPLLRRPWQTLTVCSSQRATLAFCGDRGGIAGDTSGTVAAVDGEIIVGDSLVSGDDAAAEVLQSYFRDGVGLRGLSGQFAAAIWDADTNELTLVVDLLGTRTALSRQAGRCLDLDGAAQVLAYEHLLGGHTPLVGVRLP